MKKIIILILISLSVKVFAQDNLDSLFYAGTDTVGLSRQIALDQVKYIADSDKVVTHVTLPSIHKDQIISFINKNVGKSVGKEGICWDLVDGAFRQWDKDWWSKKNPYGVQINHRDLLPGDIILTEGEVELDGKASPAHVMIVYAIVGDQVEIMNQSKGQVVHSGEFDYDVYKSGNKKISIKCFRPE